jgi:ribosomal protein S18 acetylase RimI-like enzyme
MIMEIYSDTDPHIEHYSNEILEYTGLARSMKFPYWVWVNNEKPIGLMTVGNEPIRMFAPAGTKMAIVEMIDAEQTRTDLDRFVEEAKQLAAKHDAEYITAVLPFDKTNAIESFNKYDFRVLADSYQMVCQLDREFNDHTDLQFLPVKREEAQKWVRQASQFLKGSPDTVLELGLRNMLDLPEAFIDLVFKSEAFFFVNKDQEAIGVLEINSKRGTISNIGVKPSERNKGYGRQIVTFGLRQLKTGNCKEARLRVHAANGNAIHLYESLGFQTKQRNLTLLWNQQDRTAT